MLALFNRVSERAIAEARRFAKKNEVAAVDDVFIRVETGENAAFRVDSVFQSRLETFVGALGFILKRVGERVNLAVRVGVERIVRRAASAAAATDKTDFNFIVFSRVRRRRSWRSPSRNYDGKESFGIS